MSRIETVKDAGKYSRTWLQQIIYPDADDKSGTDPYLSMLDGYLIYFLKRLRLQTVHKVVGLDEGNLPYLAYKYHRNQNTWWIIGMWNGITNIYTDMPPGTMINIPSLDSIEEYFRLVQDHMTKPNRFIELG